MNQSFADRWDDAFFTRFIELRSRIYRKHRDFVAETVEDLKLFFGPQSSFAKKMTWKAVLIENQGRVVARYLFSMHPTSQRLSLGFFECLENESTVKDLLFADIQSFRARFPQLIEVQGPIQGSLFAGFRFREKTSQPRFLGESLHLDYYPELWKKWGFEVEEFWDSYALDIKTGKAFFRQTEENLKHLWQDPKIQCRSLHLNEWKSEVHDIFQITTEAYKLAGTNNEIDESIFLALSEKIRPLLSPKTVKILEYDHKTVGFTICYIDIQRDIRGFNRRKKYLPSLVNKALLFAQIKLRRHPLLLFYIAKSAGCPVKWAMTKLGCSALDDITPQRYTGVISALNAQSAGSRASLPPDKVLLSRHFLMTLPLT